MVKAIAINFLVKLVRDFPNDKELGTELRKYMSENYGV